MQNDIEFKQNFRTNDFSMTFANQVTEILPVDGSKSINWEFNFNFTVQHFKTWSRVYV